jgi:hypothetical protein
MFSIHRPRQRPEEFALKTISGQPIPAALGQGRPLSWERNGNAGYPYSPLQTGPEMAKNLLRQNM